MVWTMETLKAEPKGIPSSWCSVVKRKRVDNKRRGGVRVEATASAVNAVMNASNVVVWRGGGAGSASAVATTVKDVFLTALAIASGACLSTKLDCLWPKRDLLPEPTELDGVDITGCRIFNEEMVQKAVAFARNAHTGQIRKTGDPYLCHCINTGKILSALVPSTGERAINTIVAGIIHDVVDDAGETLTSIEREFGEDVVSLVAGVSRLSFINQLLRRHRRKNEKLDMLRNVGLASAEVNNLRTMLLGMVDDPRVLLIKLADRLHNMRTIYALSPEKALSVAQETLAIWCPLASRIGMWAVKAELEDLCFAVLQPKLFIDLRAKLASLWTCKKDKRSLRTVKSTKRRSNAQKGVYTHHNKVEVYTEIDFTMKELIQSVIPFDLLCDRGRRSNILSKWLDTSNFKSGNPKVVNDAEVALASLVACEEALEKELLISTPYIPGMEVTLSGRLKSLYSTHCKMERKGIPIESIYDVRALRVIVGDGGGTMHAAAVECCYSLLNVVHSLWTPLDGEFDDYIVNPKPTGYQSLHTAVQGPDGAPLEIQIRTQSMHEYAEFGHAAHWQYKESSILRAVVSFPTHENETMSQNGANDRRFRERGRDNGSARQTPIKVSSFAAGHPVLRVDNSRLLAAVIIRVDNSGKELLVAVSFSIAAPETLVSGRSDDQLRRWELYARLYKKVSKNWWFAPGHGDWNTCLEKYVLCEDGIYHKQDQFQRLLPTFIYPVNLTEKEREEYWKVVSAIFDGKQITASLSSGSEEKSTSIKLGAAALTPELYKKIHLLREMLQWENQMHQESLFGMVKEASLHRLPSILTEVAIILWPEGDIMRTPLGSTAGDVARRLGLNGDFILVNGRITPPTTQLRDGDIVEVKL